MNAGHLRTSWVSATRLIDVRPLRRLFARENGAILDAIDDSTFHFLPREGDIPPEYQGKPSSWSDVLEYVWSGYLTASVMEEVCKARMHYLSKSNEVLLEVVKRNIEPAAARAELCQWKSPEQAMPGSSIPTRTYRVLYREGVPSSLNEGEMGR